MSPIPGDSRQDPHHPDDDDISFAAMDTNIIIAGSSSDSAGEDDDSPHHGYQILSQDPEDNDEQGHIGVDLEGAEGGGSVSGQIHHFSPDGEGIARNTFSSYLQVPDILDSELAERKSLWSESRLHPHEPMDEDHLNKIKSAMSGFHLPKCQVPDWACVISEEDWKTQLLARLHQRVNLVHSPPSSQDGTEGGDPPSKRPKCGLEQNEEKDMSDEESQADEGVTIDQIENDTEER